MQSNVTLDLRWLISPSTWFDCDGFFSVSSQATPMAPAPINLPIRNGCRHHPHRHRRRDFPKLRCQLIADGGSASVNDWRKSILGCWVKLVWTRNTMQWTRSQLSCLIDHHIRTWQRDAWTSLEMTMCRDFAYSSSVLSVLFGMVHKQLIETVAKHHGNKSKVRSSPCSSPFHAWFVVRTVNWDTLISCISMQYLLADSSCARGTSVWLHKLDLMELFRVSQKVVRVVCSS